LLIVNYSLAAKAWYRGMYYFTVNTYLQVTIMNFLPVKAKKYDDEY